MLEERAITFTCRDEFVLGILHSDSGCVPDTLIVFVVGGPQYRVGSHRMFVRMARSLRSRTIAVFRFDCRGMGDSEGSPRTFTDISDDVRAAISVATAQTGCRSVTLLGLCDGASAIAILCEQAPPEVKSVVLINPWVRQPATEARARVRSYYPKRIVSKEFWLRVLKGETRILRALISFVRHVMLAESKMPLEASFVEQMKAGLVGFGGSLSILLSEDDITAQEFRALVSSGRDWEAIGRRAKITEIRGADHTFSSHDAMKALVQHLRGLV